MGNELPSYLRKDYKPETNIVSSTILRYLPMLAKYDTWYSIRFSAGKSNFPTIYRLIKYGLQKGFIKIEHFMNKKSMRMQRRFVVVPGRYHVKLSDIEGVLEIKVDGGNTLIVSLKTSYNIE